MCGRAPQIPEESRSTQQHLRQTLDLGVAQPTHSCISTQNELARARARARERVSGGRAVLINYRPETASATCAVSSASRQRHHHVQNSSSHRVVETENAPHTGSSGRTQQRRGDEGHVCAALTLRPRLFGRRLHSILDRILHVVPHLHGFRDLTADEVHSFMNGRVAFQCFGRERRSTLKCGAWLINCSVNRL